MRQSNSNSVLADLISGRLAELRLSWRAEARSDDVAVMHVTGQGEPALDSIAGWLRSGSTVDLRRMLAAPPWSGNEGGADAPLSLLVSLGATLRQLVSERSPENTDLVATVEQAVLEMANSLDALTREHVRKLEEQLATDSLTGADSREQIMRKLVAESARSVRHGRPLSVVYLDVDGLKTVNDEQGHAAGDEVLKTLVKLVRENTRVTDAFGRPGGDEFLLVLPETDLAGAEFVANKLADLLSAAGAGVTAGAAGPPQTSPEPEALIAAADVEMRAAKAARGGQG